MEYPVSIQIENGRKWLVIKEETKPEWWQRWSNTNYTYVPISSPLLSYSKRGKLKETPTSWLA